MKILQVINSAYRCTIEEQDDPVVWITHAMSGAGAGFAVLLRGNAVNYAVGGQDAGGLVIGGRTQKQPPRLARDIGALLGKGIAVHAVREDCEELGLRPAALIEGVETVARADLPALFDGFDAVWNW